MQGYCNLMSALDLYFLGRAPRQDRIGNAQGGAMLRGPLEDSRFQLEVTNSIDVSRSEQGVDKNRRRIIYREILRDLSQPLNTMCCMPL